MRKLFFISLIVFICFLTIANFTQAQETLRIENPIKAETLQQLIEDIITVVRNVVASLSIIAFIIAAILYATSAGNPERMNMAKSFLIYVIIGVVIVLVAQAAVNTMRSVFGSGS